jgi:hypothetical protein
VLGPDTPNITVIASFGFSVGVVSLSLLNSNQTVLQTADSVFFFVALQAGNLTAGTYFIVLSLTGFSLENLHYNLTVLNSSVCTTSLQRFNSSSNAFNLSLSPTTHTATVNSSICLNEGSTWFRIEVPQNSSALNVTLSLALPLGFFGLELYNSHLNLIDATVLIFATDGSVGVVNPQKGAYFVHLFAFFDFFFTQQYSLTAKLTP